MKEKQFDVNYQYIQDDKSLEAIFTFIFDEIQKVINSKQSDEQRISVNTASI